MPHKRVTFGAWDNPDSNFESVAVPVTDQGRSSLPTRHYSRTDFITVTHRVFEDRSDRMSIVESDFFPDKVVNEIFILTAGHDFVPEGEIELSVEATARDGFNGQLGATKLE